MGTRNSGNTKPVHAAEYGNAVKFHDAITTVAGDVGAAAVVQLVKVAAGTEVDRVVVKNTDLDAHATPTLTAKIGFAPIDGSAAVAGADTAVSADAAFGQAAATTTFEIFPPYLVEVDSWLSITVGTGAATAAAGTIDAKVEGIAKGVR